MRMHRCNMRCAVSLPHGERGLKFVSDNIISAISASLPHGERGLKYKLSVIVPCDVKSLPHGERGLKYNYLRRVKRLLSRSHTGSVD